FHPARSNSILAWVSALLIVAFLLFPYHATSHTLMGEMMGKASRVKRGKRELNRLEAVSLWKNAQLEENTDRVSSLAGAMDLPVQLARKFQEMAGSNKAVSLILRTSCRRNWRRIRRCPEYPITIPTAADSHLLLMEMNRTSITATLPIGTASRLFHL